MRDFRQLLEAFNAFIEHHRHCGHIVDGHIAHDLNRDGIRIVLRLQSGEDRSFKLSGHEMRMDGERAFRHWIEVIENDLMRRTFRRWDCTIRQPARYESALFGLDFAAGHDPKAIKKAKDLFKLAAGKKAFNTLEAGKPLNIKGSKGTEYTLHNRATYCVERVKDGAKLCAVVPDVPLFDHLLGIKLMVENDEPAFLKTANVSLAR